MPTYLRLTSIATLLISLQLLSPKLLPTKTAWNILNNHTSNHAFVAANHNLKEDTTNRQSNLDEFMPTDYGHPTNTRGSGTR
ncbi:MAG: hypothetical protein ABI417_02005 [Coleofasciculaceae cyanobacterium]|jgi:hypothetical protein